MQAWCVYFTAIAFEIVSTGAWKVIFTMVSKRSQNVANVAVFKNVIASVVCIFYGIRIQNSIHECLESYFY